MCRLFWVVVFSVLELVTGDLSGQTLKIAVAKKDFSRATGPADRLGAALDICRQSHSLNLDTLYYYADFARQSAARLGDDEKKIRADTYLETWLERKNQFDSALSLCNADLKSLRYFHPGDAYVQVMMQKCYDLVKSSRSKEALNQAYQLLAAAEKNDDTVAQIFCKCTIGMVYRNMQQTDLAFKWFNLANHSTENPGLEEIKNELGVFFQLGLMYNWKADVDDNPRTLAVDSAMSIYFLDRAITDSRKYENLAMLARSLNVKAAAIGNREHVQEEGRYVTEAAGIFNMLRDTLSMLNSISPLCFYYMDEGHPEKGIAACLQGIQMVGQGRGYPIFDLYETLSQCYKASGNDKKYAETLHTMIVLKDSMYKINSERDLADLNARYEDQKKENIIISQKLDLASKRYTVVVFSAISFILFIGIAALSLYFQKKNREQKRKNAIAITEAAESERKRISADLHDNIGAYAAAAASTISTMQPADAQSRHSLAMLKNNVQDMITQLNDSIWALNKAEVRLTSVSDRFKVFIRKLEHAYPNIGIGYEEDIETDRLLTPFQGLHLFRFMQEALNNALRHSRCSQVNIVTTSDQRRMQVTIADNGRGMAKEIQRGHGISNLKSRAKESGWTAEWRTPDGGGTVVIVSAGPVAETTISTTN